MNMKFCLYGLFNVKVKVKYHIFYKYLFLRDKYIKFRIRAKEVKIALNLI